MKFRFPPAVGSLVAACLLLTGCQDASKKGPRTHSMEGVAKAIDAKTRVVSMTVYRDGKEQDVSATLRDDADVLINGRQQKINDVVPGDKVKAFYQKDPANDKYVVVKVEVVRAAESDWKKAEPVKGPTADSTAKPPDNTVAVRNDEPNTAAQQDATQPPPAVSPDRVQREADTYDAIYGEIRRQMEEAIQKRKDLISGGRDPSDVEIRQLEQKIMKAKGLLEERGELVEEIDPPIVTARPPGTTPPG